MDSGGCGLRSIPLPLSLGDRTSSGSEAERRAAFGYFSEAWAEARLEGIDGDCLAQVALFSALPETWALSLPRMVLVASAPAPLMATPAPMPPPTASEAAAVVAQRSRTARTSAR